MSEPIPKLELPAPSKKRSAKRPALRRVETREAFQAPSSIRQLKKQDPFSQGIDLLYAGIAVQEVEDGKVDVALVCHDETYSIDFTTFVMDIPSRPSTPIPSSGARAAALADYIVKKLSTYSKENTYKFVGAGLTKNTFEMCPQLPSRLYQEYDIVAFVFERSAKSSRTLDPQKYTEVLVDEEADSMARKCVLRFNSHHQPHLQTESMHEVGVDSGGEARITLLRDYPETVGDRTWEATSKYAESLRQNGIRVAFFNSTPQGGGVALMRHALIRLLRLLEVDVRWYVPRPKPEIFRITKNNHNILQGVAEDGIRISEEQIAKLDNWARDNAEKFWIWEDGPLAPRSQGGADVIVVDDPQMPSLVKIAKELDPERPVIFRSHIQVRADLADQEETPTSEVWNWIWENVKQADVFISHPVREFVPNNVHFERVGYMPATTDWLDGLNKPMNKWDEQYYIYMFNEFCRSKGANTLDYPNREYIVQIARFDPAKGIPDVLASYAELRRNYMKNLQRDRTPQLVIAGHGAVDDPDANIIFNDTMARLQNDYPDLINDVIVIRLPHIDQYLNALMSCAHVALQLSTREGFEVKVSEALHKGVPVIATKAGGIPLQVQDGKSGFLVESGDYKAVAKHLHYLFTEDKAYDEMSKYAEDHVSDEVSTVGNALCWLYLADELAKGKKIKPNSKWINDMAREEAGLPYEEGETRLPRSAKLDLHRQ
ncbi:putative trehalose synthase-like protein [Lophiotrema nucula]|uniref:Putative trehalose synthase-like protein n=1 Tax=Lophiotrema nucula TaxID=690887 RepID=A0A6A5Z677_9PLEO|nr:putative trehalose synthase-like protein [Lophiotrema nucula]